MKRNGKKLMEVWNEMKRNETKRNETKRNEWNETKRNETKRNETNETKRNETKRNEMKRNETKRNETKRMKRNETKRNETKWNEKLRKRYISVGPTIILLTSFPCRYRQSQPASPVWGPEPVSPDILIQAFNKIILIVYSESRLAIQQRNCKLYRSRWVPLNYSAPLSDTNLWTEALEFDWSSNH